MKDFVEKYFIIEEFPNNKKRNDENIIFLSDALLDLITKNRIDSTFNKFCESLFKQASVSKKFFRKYTHHWKPVVEDGPAGSEASALATLVLYIWVKKSEIFHPDDLGKKINVLNTILVCIKQSKELWTTDNSKFYLDILKDLDDLTVLMTDPAEIQVNQSLCVQEKLPPIEPKTISLTILYSEGPIGRAYLETFKTLNLQPKKIVRIVFSRDRSSGKSIGQFLFGKLRLLFCYQIEEFRMNYWPRKIKQTHPEVFGAISKTLSNQLGFPIDAIENTTGQVDFGKYATSVESLLIKDFHDDRLVAHLSENCEGEILYTGGGIVPQKILDLKNITMLHIHPGFLPGIRGADCSLWSNLVYESPSASAFIMAPKIDTGDVVLSTWLPKIEINIHKDYSVDTLYRAIFSFIDPWIRSYALRLLLLLEDDVTLRRNKQPESAGITYYFMSTEVRERALKKYFIKLRES